MNKLEIIEVIKKDFQEWAKKEKKINNSHIYARQLPKAFDYLKDKKDNGVSEVEYDFLDLLPILLKNKQTKEISLLIACILCSSCKIDWPKKNGNRKDSLKTFLVTFLGYVENASKRTAVKDALKDFTLDPAEVHKVKVKLDAAFDNRMVFTHNDLCIRFMIRLRRQDRISGDKIWLPLSFIAKLYNPEGKRGKGFKTPFTEWIYSLVNDVYVHYEEIGKVKSANFSQQELYLEFIKNKNNEFDVYVILSKNGRKGKCYRALTPTGKGNCKESMTVRKIGDIAIDHVKPIDQTLRDLELPFLEIVSDVFKAIQDDENINEKILIKELSNWNFLLAGLKKDLDKIQNDGLLRLMASKYNSQKGNANTFQEIAKIKDQRKKQYIGIIEGDVDIFDDYGNKNIIYYQMLTDVIGQNIFRVKDKSKLKFLSRNIKDKKDLIKIIDFI